MWIANSVLWLLPEKAGALVCSFPLTSTPHLTKAQDDDPGHHSTLPCIFNNQYMEPTKNTITGKNLTHYPSGSVWKEERWITLAEVYQQMFTLLNVTVKIYYNKHHLKDRKQTKSKAKILNPGKHIHPAKGQCASLTSICFL